MKQCPFKYIPSRSGHVHFMTVADRDRPASIGDCTPDCQLWDPDRQDCKLGVMAQALNSIAVEIKKIMRKQ